MTKPQRPATPTLDQARAEQEAIVQHEQELAQYEREQAAAALTTARQAEVEGVEEADLTEGAAAPMNATLALKLPDRSFTLVEAAISGD